MCAATHLYVTCLIYTWHNSLTYNVTHLYMTILLYICNVSHSCVTWFIRVVFHLYVTWLIHMSHNEYAGNLYVTWLIHMVSYMNHVKLICMWHDLCVCHIMNMQKWPVYTTRETYKNMSHDENATRSIVLRNTHTWQKRHKTKETCKHDKRDIQTYTKWICDEEHRLAQHTQMTEKTCIFDRKDLHTWQKSPTWKQKFTYMTEKTYIYDSKDLQIWAKRPSYVNNVQPLYIQTRNLCI